MIKFNNSNINDWFYNSSDIIKVYHNGAVCYYKLTPSGQTPCFAVVDDISQYSDTEFIDVFNQADGKWYKLNNLNQYEEYGVYDSTTATTYYDGKLVIQDNYEYQYSGSGWNNVGEISGTTATLPNVPFVLNYNAKNYDATTHTIPMTEGQLNGMDAVITGTTSNIADYSSDGYIRLNGSTQTVLRARVSNSSNNSYFNRTNSNSNLTVVAKILTQNSNTADDILVNRDSSYNWMYRHKPSLVTLHGSSEQGSIAVSNTVPNICSARVASNRLLTYNNWTQNTTSTYNNFNYGNTTTDGGTLFGSYATTNDYFWKGDFYWVYMTQNTLSDEEVQQVIAYNEEGGGQTEYPVYYDEIQDPPSAVTFSSMTEAEEYECPYVGLQATIDGDRYVFSGDSTSGYEWVEIISPIPSEYDELQWVEVPRGYDTDFQIPYDFQTYYKYSIDFTPVNFYYDSYYGGIFGAPTVGDTNDLFFMKMDNGWGDEYYRLEFHLHNYRLDTRSGFSDMSGKFAVFDGVKAKISLNLSGYTTGQGAVITVENEGMSAFTGVGTTTMGQYTPTYGVQNMYMFGFKNYNYGKTVDMKFHNFKIETSGGTEVYDYRPVKRRNDNKVGIFDTVNQRFYYPTDFTLTAGPTV